VITGDVTQIDLPNARRSGLLEAADVLKSVEGLTFVYFDETDVVRHHLVQRIVRAYDEHKMRLAEQQMPLLAVGKNVEARAVEVMSEANTPTEGSNRVNGGPVAKGKTPAVSAKSEE
jgi:phosphate starvation-inducible PhoH-like protein